VTALHRTVVYCEYYAVALLKANYLRARLHPRPLLSQHKLAASEILGWRRKQERNL
jgi:hypothetical protein